MKTIIPFIFFICSCLPNDRESISSEGAVPVDSFRLLANQYVPGSRLIISKTSQPETGIVRVEGNVVNYVFSRISGDILDSFSVKEDLRNTNYSLFKSGDSIYVLEEDNSHLYIYKNKKLLKTIYLNARSKDLAPYCYLIQKPFVVINNRFFMNFTQPIDWYDKHSREQFYRSSNIVEFKIDKDSFGVDKMVSTWDKKNLDSFYIDVNQRFDVNEAGDLAYSSRVSEWITILGKQAHIDASIKTGYAAVQPFNLEEKNKSNVVRYNILNGDLENIIFDMPSQYIWRINKLPY